MLEKPGDIVNNIGDDLSGSFQSEKLVGDFLR